uniref:Uncharacterized protein n=1 Tax=Fundulus heteroclitus TaxID=8078 RepID=A0A3Q2QAU3_FUNHE
MATDGSGSALEEGEQLRSADPGPGGNIPKRHARVTVKYNRKELQRRLDVEKWIDQSLDRLYRGQVGPTARCCHNVMPFFWPLFHKAQLYAGYRLLWSYGQTLQSLLRRTAAPSRLLCSLCCCSD